MILSLKSSDVVSCYKEVIFMLSRNTTSLTSAVLSIDYSSKDFSLVNPIDISLETNNVFIDYSKLNDFLINFNTPITKELCLEEKSFWEHELFVRTDLHIFIKSFRELPDNKKNIHSFWTVDLNSHTDTAPSTIFFNASLLNHSTQDFFLNVHLRSSYYKGLMLLDMFLFEKIGLLLADQSLKRFHTLNLFIDKLKL